MPVNILVADDEPGVVDLCHRILTRCGYSVEAVTSGQEALARLQASPVDLLLVDIKMPDVDGLTVLRRGRDLWPDMAAVIVTGYATLSSAVEALHAGAHRFVLKPFAAGELVQAVQEALELRQREEERLRLRAQLPILEIAQALLVEGDLELLARQILEPVARELAADPAVLLAVDPESDTLYVVGTAGRPVGPSGARIPVSATFVEQLRQGAGPIVADPSPWLQQSMPAALDSTLRTVVCVPLRTVKRLVGALCLGRKEGAAPFTPSNLSLLAIIGGQIATVMENARLYEIVARGKREWEATFDAIADGISIHDTAYRVLRANQSLARRLGLLPQDLIGRRCHELVHGTSAAPDSCPAARALETGRPQTVELELPQWEGIFQCTVYPLDQEGGGPRRFVHVLRDITEQKRAEGLSQAQRDLGVALAATRGLDATARLCLETAIRVAGMDSGGIYLVDGAGAMDLVFHQGLSADFVAQVIHMAADSPSAQLVRAGQPLYSVYEHRHTPLDDIRNTEGLRTLAVVPILHEGRVTACLNVSSHTLDRVPEPRRAALESVAHLIGSAISRAQAEEALHRRNEELAALNAIAATLGQQSDLRAILNAALDKVLELTALDGGWIQLLDDKSARLLPAVHRNIPAAMVETLGQVRLGEGVTGAVAQAGQPHFAEGPAEQTLLGEDARHAGILLTALLPLRAPDQVLGVLALFSRSARCLAPHDRLVLIAISHQLGVAVENARLAQQTAEVMVLRELDRLRSELTANVSHELRTPLGLIKIMTTTLLRPDAALDDATRREFLEGVVDEAGRLEKIVDNLLDLSRQESGRLQLECRATDLGCLLRETAVEMALRYPHHHLACEVPADALRASVDPERIGQVLRNLVDNAAKYSPAGATITIRGRPAQANVLVQVADQGIGIPPEDRERVFERFYRVPNEVTMRERGAGLGLAVCKGIVEAHGGQIWVESGLGQGSTFSFTVPAAP